MARYQTSVSRLAYQLFVILALLLTLGLVWQCYIRYSKAVRENNYYHTDTYFKTVQDSVLKAQPARVVRQPVYVPVPTGMSPLATQRLVQAVAAQVRADVQRQSRADMARLLALQRPVVAIKQGKTAALRDTAIVRKSVRTGRPVVTITKTATFHDPWLQMTSTIVPGDAGRPDSITAKYVVRNDFNVKAYSRREAKHWWGFGKRRVYVDLTNKNPNATSTKLEAIPVEKK
jgi:hypothetical protein